MVQLMELAMACRLHNRSKHVLRIDMRGGTALQLAPGATSDPLREELLYENMFLPQWEREGMVVRLSARFDEVLAREATAAGVAAPDPSAPRKQAKKAGKGAKAEEKGEAGAPDVDAAQKRQEDERAPKT
jgi:hypothetical protein